MTLRPTIHFSLHKCLLLQPVAPLLRIEIFLDDLLIKLAFTLVHKCTHTHTLIRSPTETLEA